MGPKKRGRGAAGGAPPPASGKRGAQSQEVRRTAITPGNCSLKEQCRKNCCYTRVLAEMYRRPIHRPQMVFTVFYHPFSIFSRSGKLFVIIICNVIIICDTIIIFVCGVNSDIYHLSLFCSVIIICGVISTVAEPVCFFTGSIFSAPAPAPIKSRLLTIKKKLDNIYHFISIFE